MIIDNDKEIATSFNNFFANVGPNTEKVKGKYHIERAVILA